MASTESTEVKLECWFQCAEALKREVVKYRVQIKHLEEKLELAKEMLRTVKISDGLLEKIFEDK